MADQVAGYYPLANYSSQLYLIIQNICRVHQLYHFSLLRFMDVFEQTLVESNITKVASSNVMARTEEIKNKFTINLYERLSNSLFIGKSTLLTLTILSFTVIG